MKKRLLKDITIPAGTIFTDAPKVSRRFGNGHVQKDFGLTNDTAGYVYYCCDDDDALNEWFENVKE